MSLNYRYTDHWPPIYRIYILLWCPAVLESIRTWWRIGFWKKTANRVFLRCCVVPTKGRWRRTAKARDDDRTWHESSACIMFTGVYMSMVSLYQFRPSYEEYMYTFNRYLYSLISQYVYFSSFPPLSSLWLGLGTYLLRDLRICRDSQSLKILNSSHNFQFYFQESALIRQTLVGSG